MIKEFIRKHKKTIFGIIFPSLLFIKLTEDLIKNELSVFDTVIYKYIREFIHEDRTGLIRFITTLGSAPVLIVISLICIYVFWRSNKYSLYSKMIGVNLLVVSLFNEVFKMIFHRERPEIHRLVEVSGFSFPSGHSMVSISFYGFIAYLFYKNMKSSRKYLLVALFSILVLFIGISRIYLGVHYVSDVIAGFAAGLAWLGVFVTLVNKIPRNKISRNKIPRKKIPT